MLSQGLDLTTWTNKRGQRRRVWYLLLSLFSYGCLHVLPTRLSACTVTLPACTVTLPACSPCSSRQHRHPRPLLPGHEQAVVMVTRGTSALAPVEFPVPRHDWNATSIGQKMGLSTWPQYARVCVKGRLYRVEARAYL